MRNTVVQGGTLGNLSTRKYSGQIAFKYGNEFITSSGTTGQRIYLNFNSNDMPNAHTTLSYSIRLNADLAASTSFGFSDVAGTNNSDPAGKLTAGPLYIFTQYNANTLTTSYSLKYNGGTEITNGTYAGGGLVDYNITYDFTANLIVEASVNGITLASNYDLGTFTPDIQALQIQYAVFGGSTGQELADDLLVVAKSPETAQLGLFIVGRKVSVKAGGMFCPTLLAFFSGLSTEVDHTVVCRNSRCGKKIERGMMSICTGVTRLTDSAVSFRGGNAVKPCLL